METNNIHGGVMCLCSHSSSLNPPEKQRSSTFQPITTPQLTNGDQQGSDGLSGVFVIPTINGETPVANQEGARVNLSDLEVRFAK